jgi:hypothetical protein
MAVPVEVDEAASAVHPPVNAFGEANLHVGELAAGPERLAGPQAGGDGLAPRRRGQRQSA